MTRRLLIGAGALLALAVTATAAYAWCLCGEVTTNCYETRAQIISVPDNATLPTTFTVTGDVDHQMRLNETLVYTGATNDFALRSITPADGLPHLLNVRLEHNGTVVDSYETVVTCAAPPPPVAATPPAPVPPAVTPPPAVAPPAPRVPRPHKPRHVKRCKPGQVRTVKGGKVRCHRVERHRPPRVAG